MLVYTAVEAIPDASIPPMWVEGSLHPYMYILCTPIWKRMFVCVKCAEPSEPPSHFRKRTRWGVSIVITIY